MRIVSSISAALVAAACQSTLPEYPQAESGPLTDAELEWSFDAAFHDPIFKNIAKSWDRDCTLTKARAAADKAGEPKETSEEEKESMPSVFVANSDGSLTAVNMDFSNREFAAAGVIQDAARECQEEQSS